MSKTKRTENAPLFEAENQEEILKSEKQENQVPGYRGWKKKTAVFFTGQMITLVGSSLVQYVIVWNITNIYQSGLITTLSVICAFLPQAIISLFAGVWADRFSKKALIILADMGIAIVSLGVAVLFIFGFEFLWLIMLVLALRSIGQGVQMPAVNAFIPDLVPKEKLLKINGIFGSMQAVITIVPIALAGLSYAFFDMYIAFFIDVGTAVIGVGLLLLLKVKKPEKPKDKIGYFTDLKAGIKFIWRNKFLKIFFLFYALLMFMVAPVAFLSSIQVARAFGTETWRLPIMEGLFAVGMMIGGIIIAFRPGFKSRTKTIGVTNFFYGGFTAMLGIIPFLHLNLELGYSFYVAAMLLLGLTVSFFNAPSITVLQETAEPEMHGRVFGVVQIVSAFSLPFGTLLFGPLADVIDIEWLMLGTGLLIVLFGFLLLKNKVLINYKDYAYKPKVEPENKNASD